MYNYLKQAKGQTMKKLSKVLLAAMLILGFGAATLSANCTTDRDTTKGQRYFQKMFKNSIFDGDTGAKVAALHAGYEWEELFENEAQPFIEEFGTTDKKKAILTKLFEKEEVRNYMKAFLTCYANDSGNVPSC